MRKFALLFVLIPSSAFCQVPVTDVAQIAEIIKIIGEVKNTYDKVSEGLQTLQRMRDPLPRLDRFRIPGVPISFHDPNKYTFAAELLNFLNKGGDPYGNAGWYKITQPLQIPPGLLATLPPEAQQILRVALASVQLRDAAAIMSTNTIGETRKYHEVLQDRIDTLDKEVTAGISEPNANLDKLSIASVIRSRQQEASNQVLSSVVESLISSEHAKREAEVQGVNQQLQTLQDNGQIWRNLMAGSGATLRNWYQ